MPSTEARTDEGVTSRGVAVVVVLIARYIQQQNPDFVLYLRRGLESVSAAGLAEQDVAFLRVVIASLVPGLD